jgi:hypothetical protein
MGTAWRAVLDVLNGGTKPVGLPEGIRNTAKLIDAEVLRTIFVGPNQYSVIGGECGIV